MSIAAEYKECFSPTLFPQHQKTISRVTTSKYEHFWLKCDLSDLESLVRAQNIGLPVQS